MFIMQEVPSLITVKVSNSNVSLELTVSPVHKLNFITVLCTYEKHIGFSVTYGFSSHPLVVLEWFSVDKEGSLIVFFTVSHGEVKFGSQ